MAYVAPDAALFDRLLPVARRIFTDTFAARYDAAAFRAYCDATYAPDGPMAKDFPDPAVHWRVALAAGESVGYAKLVPLRAPAPEPRPGAMELQQIYVLAPWQGTGVADALLGWARATAIAHGAPELYLTVFDHNERAKRFYRRHGFEEVGRCTFTLGDRTDDDRVWRAAL